MSVQLVPSQNGATDPGIGRVVDRRLGGLVGGHDRRAAHEREAALRGDDLGAEGKAHGSRRAIDDQRFLPGRAVRTDLDVKIVVAGETELGAAGVVGLVERARRIAGGGLVDLLLVAVADVVEEAGRALDGEAVGGVGGGIDAPDRGAAAGAGGQLGPRRAAVGVDLVLVGDPGEPALARGEERPGAVLPGRDLAGLAGPGAGRAGGDDVAVAVGGRARRAGEVLVEHHQLHERVERADGLVVGDVLLGLGGDDVGERQVRGAVHARGDSTRLLLHTGAGCHSRGGRG